MYERKDLEKELKEIQSYLKNLQKLVKDILDGNIDFNTSHVGSQLAISQRLCEKALRRLNEIIKKASKQDYKDIVTKAVTLSTIFSSYYGWISIALEQLTH